MAISLGAKSSSSPQIQKFMKAANLFHSDLKSVKERDLDLASSPVPSDDFSQSFGSDTDMRPNWVRIDGFGSLTDGVNGTELHREALDKEVPESDTHSYAWKRDYQFESSAGDIKVEEKLMSKDDSWRGPEEYAWKAVYSESYVIDQNLGVIADIETVGSIPRHQGTS